MKFSSTFLITAALKASSGLATPSSRIRDESQDATFEIESAIKAATTDSKLSADDSIKTMNWAGAAKAGTNINSVTGTVNVPAITVHPDGWNTGMAIFAGLDGYFDCPDSLVTAGIIVTARKGYPRESEFTAFWRWGQWSGGSENQIDFPIRAGDQIRLTVSLEGDEAMSARGTVENLSTGQSEFRVLGGPVPACRTHASWAISDYRSLGELIRWANFTDPVTFTEASATTASGEVLTLEGADLLDIEQPGLGQLTDCRINDASGLTCVHAG